MSNIITRAEREARRNQPAAPGEPKPIAQWRKKGCTSCKPIPVYSKPTVDQTPKI